MENNEIAQLLSACADETEMQISELESMMTEMRVVASRLLTAPAFQEEELAEAERLITRIIECNRSLDDIGSDVRRSANELRNIQRQAEANYGRN